MISASKTTFSLNNLKILRPKVTKNLTNLLKKFCEFSPRAVSYNRVRLCLQNPPQKYKRKRKLDVATLLKTL